MKRLDRICLRDDPSALIKHQNKTCPFLTAAESNENSSITPIRLRESVFSTNPDRASEHWEQKAKNFRLIQRQINPNTVREKVPITLNNSPKEKLCFSFSLKQNNLFSTSSSFSIQSIIPRGLSINLKKSKRKKFRHKNLNFFLHI